MPKMKTNRTAYKKLSPNKNGKIKRGHACKRHMTGKKSSKRMRGLDGSALVSYKDAPNIMRMLPYGGR